METVSASTRRLIAFGLLFVVTITALNLIIVPLVALVHGRLSKLGDLRFQRAQLEAVMARPDPPLLAPMPAETLIVAAAPELARRQLSTLLQGNAATAGVHVISLVPESDIGGLAVVRAAVGIEGPELAVVSFLNHLEQGRPLARMRAWKLVKAETPEGALRLTGEVVAAWGRGQ